MVWSSQLSEFGVLGSRVKGESHRDSDRSRVTVGREVWSGFSQKGTDPSSA